MEEKVISLIFKLLFKGISFFIEYASWKIYFESAAKLTIGFNESDAVEICKHTFHKSAFKSFEIIKEDLNALDCDGSIKDDFFVHLIDIVKEKQPILFFLYKFQMNDHVLDGLQQEISSVTDNILSFQNCVIEDIETIDEIDFNLKDSSYGKCNHRIGLDFFDFDDDLFTNNLKEKIEQKKSFNLFGKYKKETFYALLCELKKIYKDDYVEHVAIVRDIRTLNKIASSNLNCDQIIVVFDEFIDDADMRIIPNHLNIHVVSKDDNFDGINLRPRLANSTRTQLQKCGFSSSEIETIISKYGNQFPEYFSYLFNINSKQFFRVKKYINIQDIITGLLIPQWNDKNKSDCEIIKMLCGKNAEELLKCLTPIELAETPFINRVIDRHGHSVLRVSSMNNEEFFTRFIKDVDENLISKFFSIFEKIVLMPPNNYFNKDNIYNSFADECSLAIREASIHSVIFLSVFCNKDYSAVVFDILKRLKKHLYQSGNTSLIKYYSSILYDFLNLVQSKLLNLSKRIF